MAIVVGGPAGALVGAVARPVLIRSLRAVSEVLRRKLSRREEIRVGGAFGVALARLKERLDQGDSIREDGFFLHEDLARSRPAPDEILEGVLLAAQRSHEERKVPLFGKLFANIAFEPSIDAAYANRLVRLAEALS